MKRAETCRGQLRGALRRHSDMLMKMRVKQVLINVGY